MIRNLILRLEQLHEDIIDEEEDKGEDPVKAVQRITGVELDHRLVKALWFIVRESKKDLEGLRRRGGPRDDASDSPTREIGERMMLESLEEEGLDLNLVLAILRQQRTDWYPASKPENVIPKGGVFDRSRELAQPEAPAKKM